MTECAYQQGFGGWMRQQREQLGLKQPEIARRMAVSTNTVRNWEHGRTSMSGFQERQIRHMFRMEREAQVSKGKQVLA